MDESLLWIALREIPGLPRLHAHELLRRYGSPGQIFGRAEDELAAYCPRELARVLGGGPDLAAAGARQSEARAAGMRIVTPDDDGFPESLRTIPDPPLLLWVRGRLPDAPAVAMVGSRRATARGLEAARSFAKALAEAGLAVVSGLAYGIDAAAHSGALEGGGPTVAALASGLDRPSPVGNRGLAKAILEAGGAWLSEYPPGTPALAAHFPERNRLISGLARLVVIVEAREASGTLWTARHAHEQDRDVLVVPGPIDSAAYRGSNALLRGQAGPLLDSEDLFVALGMGGLALARSGPPGEQASTGNRAGTRVLERLQEGPAAADELGRALGLSAADLARVLLDLELDGRIRRTGSRIARVG